VNRRIRFRNPALAAALARNGLTGKLLAEKAGINPTTVSALLCQRRDPKPQTANVIARILGEKPKEVFPEFSERAVK